jgi:hypothetical protein
MAFINNPTYLHVIDRSVFIHGKLSTLVFHGLSQIKQIHCRSHCTVNMGSKMTLLCKINNFKKLPENLSRTSVNTLMCEFGITCSLVISSQTYGRAGEIALVTNYICWSSFCHVFQEPTMTIVQGGHYDNCKRNTFFDAQNTFGNIYVFY